MFKCIKKADRVYVSHTAKISLVLLIWIITGVSAAGCGREMSANAAEPLVEKTAEDTSVDEAANEDENEDSGGAVMTREFVEVALVAEDHMMLENTKGLFYWVDIKYNKNYSEGDLLCLVFKDKLKLEEDCWKVEPSKLYVNDNRVNIPNF